MGRDARRALGLVCIMMLAPLAGCFGETGEDSRVGTGDITITPETLIGGVFQGLTSPLIGISPHTFLTLSSILTRSSSKIQP